MWQACDGVVARKDASYEKESPSNSASLADYATFRAGLVPVAMPMSSRMSNPAYVINFGDCMADPNYWRPPTTCRARMEPHECGQDIRNGYLCDSRVDKFPRVLGQTAPLAERSLIDSGGESPSLFPRRRLTSRRAGCCDVGFGQSCCSRWTASAEFIILERIGTANQTLVTTYPGVPSPTTQYIVGQGTDQLYSSDLTQGFAGGPKVGLLWHGENGYDLEASFFQIDGWNNAASIASGTDTTPVFVAPGGFVQTTDSATQSMEWEYATRLYNAEINVRWDLCPRVTMLAGFRWVDLSEHLEGTLPPERKMPFWDNTTRNNLYGFQIGTDGKLFERRRFSIDGLVKAGIFDDNVDETTMVSIY